MPKLTDRLPKYGRHKASGQAVVKFDNVTRYLGPHGSKKSKAEYKRLRTQFLATRDQPLPMGPDRSELTIVELVAAFKRFGQRHYLKDGRPTGELRNILYAASPLLLLYGRELVRDFGPLKLKTVQAILVAGYQDARGNEILGLSRNVVNASVGRIKRVFKWAVSEEIAPPSLAHALAAVAGLQRGRTSAREREPFKPVPEDQVEATLPFLPEVVADMVRLQQLLGARPGEICAMRPCDIDQSNDVWCYRPAAHKTAHHGRARTIYIGPRAQQILSPYLLQDSDAFCFAPADSEKKRKAALRAARKSPVQPSQIDRSKSRPQLQPGKVYDLNGSVVLRAREMTDPRPTELVLSHSMLSGQPIAVCIDRQFLARAIQLGFSEVCLFGREAPALCDDGERQYVWALLDPDALIRTCENANRIESSEHGTGAPVSRPRRRWNEFQAAR